MSNVNLPLLLGMEKRAERREAFSSGMGASGSPATVDEETAGAVAEGGDVVSVAACCCEGSSVTLLFLRRERKYPPPPAAFEGLEGELPGGEPALLPAPPPDRELLELVRLKLAREAEERCNGEAGVPCSEAGLEDEVRHAGESPGPTMFGFFCSSS